MPTNAHCLFLLCGAAADLQLFISAGGTQRLADRSLLFCCSRVATGMLQFIDQRINLAAGRSAGTLPKDESLGRKGQIQVGNYARAARALLREIESNIDFYTRLAPRGDSRLISLRAADTADQKE